MYLNKKLTIIIFTVLITIFFGVILIRFSREDNQCNIELNPNQRIIDYAFNDRWLFAIIEDKGAGDCKRDIYIYKSVVSSKADKWEKVAGYDFTAVSPWKIRLGNIDYTDGPQVIIGVNKLTHFDKEINNRLFVFNWDGEKLYKKWTGTRLGYYLKDFYIIDFLDIKGDELVVIDKNEEGKERLLVYYWMDFGFQLLAESKFYDKIEDVKYLDYNLLELAYENQDKKTSVKVIVKEGQIIEID